MYLSVCVRRLGARLFPFPSLHFLSSLSLPALRSCLHSWRQQGLLHRLTDSYGKWSDLAGWLAGRTVDQANHPSTTLSGRQTLSLLDIRQRRQQQHIRKHHHFTLQIRLMFVPVYVCLRVLCCLLQSDCFHIRATAPLRIWQGMGRLESQPGRQHFYRAPHLKSCCCFRLWRRRRLLPQTH